MKTPVVFWAFDDVILHESVLQVGVAVGADAVGGEEPARRIADQGVGSFSVIKTQDVGRSKIGTGADFDPAVGVGPCVVGGLFPFRS